MAVSAVMADMLHSDADLDALAYVDFRTGAVLSASTRDERSRLALEIAAQAASQLCAAPPLAARDSHVGETLVVSDSAVNAADDRLTALIAGSTPIDEVGDSITIYRRP